MVKIIHGGGHESKHPPPSLFIQFPLKPLFLYSTFFSLYFFVIGRLLFFPISSSFLFLFHIYYLYSSLFHIYVLHLSIYILYILHFSIYITYILHFSIYIIYILHLPLLLIFFLPSLSLGKI